jgi:hypothetical protein
VSGLLKRRTCRHCKRKSVIDFGKTRFVASSTLSDSAPSDPQGVTILVTIPSKGAI